MSIHRVHFSVDSIGKRQEDSKKRAKWVYVVAGKQHEIEFTWSLRSGKQEVTLDGQTVMFTKKKGRSVFDETLTKMGETPNLQVVCARKAPVKAHPAFRCYELLINDKPFGTYPSLHPNDEAKVNVDSTIEGDIMESGDPFYDGPMSILDILFPGKYSAAPAKQVPLEADMTFDPEEPECSMVVSEQQVSPYALPGLQPQPYPQQQLVGDLLD